MERVAVQVLLYKGSKYLPMLLRSLKAQTFSDWKLYVCENSLDPNEAANAKRLLEESGIAHHFFVAPDNLGFAGGHNALFRLHSSEFFFALNQDAYLEPGYIAACVARFEAEPNCGSVTGLVYRWTVDPASAQVITDETLIDTAGLMYHCLGNVVDRFAGQSRAEVKQNIGAPERVFGVSAAIAVYRRSAIEVSSPESLPFDPTFWMYKEDVDLAIRLKRKGFDAWFEPAAIAFHGRSLKVSDDGMLARIRDERQRNRRIRIMSYRNQWMLYVYHWSSTLGAADTIRTKLKELPRGILVFVASPSVFCAAWANIFRSLPSAWARRKKLRKLGLRNIKLV
jgi:GT2 family glycosyltransferase